MLYNDDVIFVISPEYLDAVYECLSRYRDFRVEGFNTSDRALVEVDRTPPYKYIGFSYISNSIEDEANIRSLLNRVNIAFHGLIDSNNPRSRIPFIFILSSNEGGERGTLQFLKAITEDLVLDNIQIMYYNFSIMTDTVIKAQMFGSILLRARTFDTVEETYEITSNNENTLKISLPFEPKFVDLFSKTSFIQIDDYINTYGKSDKILYDMRCYLYNDSQPLMQNITEEIAKLEPDKRIYYEVCLDFLVGHRKEFSREIQ